MSSSHLPTNSPENKNKQGAIIGGWICFALGLIFMYSSVWTFVLYAPLFFVAFILAIVAMAQRRVAGGAILLLSCLIVPGITFLVVSASRTKKFMDQHPSPLFQQQHFQAPVGSQNSNLQPAAKPTAFSQEDLQAVWQHSTSPTPLYIQQAIAADLTVAEVKNFASLPGFQNFMGNAAFSPDETLFAITVNKGGSNNAELQILRVPSGMLLTKVPITHSAKKIFWRKDMRQIGYVADDDHFHVIDIAEGKDIELPVASPWNERTAIAWVEADTITGANNSGSEWKLINLDLNTLKFSSGPTGSFEEVQQQIDSRQLDDSIKPIPVNLVVNGSSLNVQSVGGQSYQRPVYKLDIWGTTNGGYAKFWPTHDRRYVIVYTVEPSQLIVLRFSVRPKPQLLYEADFDVNSEINNLREEEQKYYEAFIKEGKPFSANLCPPVKNPLNGITIAANQNMPMAVVQVIEWQKDKIVFRVVDEKDTITSDAVLGPLNAQYDGCSVHFRNDFWAKTIPLDEDEYKRQKKESSDAQISLLKEKQPQLFNVLSNSVELYGKLQDGTKFDFQANSFDPITGKFTGELAWQDSSKNKDRMTGVLNVTGMGFQEVQRISGNIDFFPSYHVFTGNWNQQSNQFEGRYVDSNRAEIKDSSPTFTMEAPDKPSSVQQNSDLERATKVSSDASGISHSTAIAGEEKRDKSKGSAVAIIDMNKVFTSYPKTVEAKLRIDEAQAIKQKELSALVNDYREHPSKALENKITELRQTSVKQLQDQSAKLRSGIVDEISQSVHELLQNGAQNLVFDLSGNSISGIPIVLYSNNAANITPSATDYLRAKINKTEKYASRAIPDIDALKLAFVDMDKVFGSYNKTKESKLRMDQAQAIKQQELSSLMDDYHKHPSKSLENEISELRQTYLKQFQDQSAKFRNENVNTIISCIRDISIKNGWNLVLDSSAKSLSRSSFILCTLNAPDLSDEIIARLNKTSTPILNYSSWTLKFAKVDMKRILSSLQINPTDLNISKIMSCLETYGKANGYNVVLDSSGLTTNQLPLIIEGDIPDISDEVISLIKNKQ